ncbi:MAG: T9SS type A sorting domain-containing protein [bacterium]|nr:MAG: T9SS type A sorting domain-containing protein [bacterium]
MERKLIIMLIATALLLVWASAWAQYQVPHSVFGNAGGIVSGSHICYHTACQTGVEISVGGSYRVKSGFWYIAEISSTVEVAIAAFAGELVDDVVVLSWAVSDPEQVSGIRLYRGDGEEEALEPLTAEPFDPEVSSYRDAATVPGRSYRYQIAVLPHDGGEIRSPVILLSLPPKPLTLHQNYPNPFNPATQVAYFLPHREMVELVIYDVQGHRVRVLVSEVQETGKYTITWNGMNGRGEAVASGVYYYRLRAGKETITRKMVLLR